MLICFPCFSFVGQGNSVLINDWFTATPWLPSVRIVHKLDLRIGLILKNNAKQIIPVEHNFKANNFRALMLWGLHGPCTSDYYLRIENGNKINDELHGSV